MLTPAQTQAVQTLTAAATALALLKVDATTMSEMFWNDLARVKGVRDFGVMLPLAVIQAVVNALP